LAPNFGLGLAKLTLLSQIRIPNAVRGRECNLEPLNLWTRERLRGIIFSMNPFDIIIIVILGYSLVRGIFRGLVKEVSSIIGVLGGFYAAFTYYTMLAKLLSGLIKETAYLNILSFLIIFCSVLIIVGILGVIIKYLLNIAFLGWVDRTSGVGFGLVKGILITSILFITLTAFLPKGSAFLKNSMLAPHVSWVSEKMAKVVSKEMKQDFMAKLGELKKAWKIPN
jgi:membrane protein required for colicin V production